MGLVCVIPIEECTGCGACRKASKEEDKPMDSQEFLEALDELLDTKDQKINYLSRKNRELAEQIIAKNAEIAALNDKLILKEAALRAVTAEINLSEMLSRGARL